MNQLCEFPCGRKDMSELFTDVYTNNTMYGTMLNVQPEISETFVFCKLFDKWINCNELFFPVLSDAGFCFSFNTVRLSEHVTNE